MRMTIFTLAMLAFVFGSQSQLSADMPAGQRIATGATDLSSATAKRKPARGAQPQPVQRPMWRSGPADPSFGPDGRRYQVPEYLRNQCYIDDGYGRFSPCSNRT